MPRQIQPAQPHAMDSDQEREDAVDDETAVASAGSKSENQKGVVTEADTRSHNMSLGLARLDNQFDSQNRRAPLQTVAGSSVHDSESSSDPEEHFRIEDRSKVNQSFTIGTGHSLESSHGKRTQDPSEEVDEDDILADIKPDSSVATFSVEEVTAASKRRKEERKKVGGRKEKDFEAFAADQRRNPFLPEY
ncbi:MAG: hypothetical protein TREMPRED_002042 [Tremellales sp. Tagirdzhanova-0007]|nr:MAG: hypothetical protein TREMPRED_002042 [Tremellales sp. Tagirdzhanova-0007]